MRSLSGSTKPSMTISALAGNRQAGHRPLDDLDRRAAHAADDLEFADAVGHFAAAHQEAHRIAATHDHHRHAFAARFVLVANLATVLAGRDVEAERLLVVDHHAVGAAIDPALVRIAHDVVAAGADVAAAVLRVPLRRRKFGDVDRIAGHDVLHHRAGFDEFRRDALHVRPVVGAETIAQLDLRQLSREAERHVLALAVEEIEEEAAALDRARHVVEHEARRVVGVRGHFRHHADVALPGETLDLFDFAELLRLFEPFAQIVIGQMRRRVRAHPGRSGRTTADLSCHRIGLIVLLGHASSHYRWLADLFARTAVPSAHGATLYGGRDGTKGKCLYVR